ncbi:unnamed protein product, partial [Rotaria sp. Silwood1]
HSTSTISTTITEQLIEETVFNAYIKASQILSQCKLSIVNPHDMMQSFEEMNNLAYKRLSRSICTTSNKNSSESYDYEDDNEGDGEDQDADEEENENDDNEKHQPNKESIENDIMNENDELTSMDEFGLDCLPNVSSSTIRGMRLFDSVN